MVDHNAIQPRSEAALSLKGTQFCEHLEKNLLGDVLCFLVLMNHTNGNIKNPGLMPPDKLLKRVPIAIFRLKNESLVTDGSANDFIEWVIHRFLSSKDRSSHHLLRV
jgi:hypothetical protein